MYRVEFPIRRRGSVMPVEILGSNCGAGSVGRQRVSLRQACRGAGGPAAVQRRGRRPRRWSARPHRADPPRPVPVDVPAVVAVRAIPPAVARRASLAAIRRARGASAPTHGPPPSTSRSAAGGCVPPGATPAGRTRRWPSGRGDAAARSAGRRARPTPHTTGSGPGLHVPVGSPWDRAVARGRLGASTPAHQKGAEVSVQVVDLMSLAAETPDVELPERPDPQWWTLATGGEPSAAQRHVLGSRRLAADRRFAQVPRGGRGIIGQARAPWLPITCTCRWSRWCRRPSAPGWPPRCCAPWPMGTSARCAMGRAAGGAAQHAAIALYERLGFTEHHQYRILCRRHHRDSASRRPVARSRLRVQPPVRTGGRHGKSWTFVSRG